MTVKGDIEKERQRYTEKSTTNYTQKMKNKKVVGLLGPISSDVSFSIQRGGAQCTVDPSTGRFQILLDDNRTFSATTATTVVLTEADKQELLRKNIMLPLTKQQPLLFGALEPVHVVVSDSTRGEEGKDPISLLASVMWGHPKTFPEVLAKVKAVGSVLAADVGQLEKLLVRISTVRQQSEHSCKTYELKHDCYQYITVNELDSSKKRELANFVVRKLGAKHSLRSLVEKFAPFADADVLLEGEKQQRGGGVMSGLTTLESKRIQETISSDSEDEPTPTKKKHRSEEDDDGDLNDVPRPQSAQVFLALSQFEQESHFVSDGEEDFLTLVRAIREKCYVQQDSTPSKKKSKQPPGSPLHAMPVFNSISELDQAQQFHNALTERAVKVQQWLEKFEATVALINKFPPAALAKEEAEKRNVDEWLAKTTQIVQRWIIHLGNAVDALRQQRLDVRDALELRDLGVVF